MHRELPCRDDAARNFRSVSDPNGQRKPAPNRSEIQREMRRHGAVVAQKGGSSWGAGASWPNMFRERPGSYTSMAPVRPPPRTPGRAAERRRRIQTGTPSPRTRGHGLTRLALGIIALTTLSSCDLLRSDSGIAEQLKRPSPAIPAYGDPVWRPDGPYVGFNHRALKA